MKISRRKVVVLGASAVSASLLPLNLLAQSDGQSAEDIIKHGLRDPDWFTLKTQ